MIYEQILASHLPAQCPDRSCRTKPLSMVVEIVVKHGVGIQKQKDGGRDGGGALGTRC